MDNLLRFILVSAHFTRHSFYRMWKNLVFKESCNLSCFYKVLIGKMIVRVSRCLYNTRSIFQHFETRQYDMDTFQLCFFFYLKMERFPPITGDKSRKSDWNWRVWLQTRVWAILSALVESQRRCQHLKYTFGVMGTLGIDWAIMMAMQPFLTTMKTETACDQAPHLRDRRSREATCEWHAKGDVRAMCRQRKWELTRACVRALAARDGEVALSP